MFARIGQKALEFTSASLRTGIRRSSAAMTNSVEIMSDTVQFASQRVKNLRFYNSCGVRNHLFSFGKNGEINIDKRVYGSEDLQFLEHIKNGHYIQPKIYPEGTLHCTMEGIEQSNKLAKDVILEKDKFIDGYRYSGCNARFDSFGRNVSRFKNGNQEIIVIDKTLDETLVKTINTFKNRIYGKTLTEEQKIKELMKFVDEVFSVSKSGEETSKYVANIMTGQQAEVLLGDIINSGAGMCRHRALLTKLLADEVNIKCRFVQGYYNSGGHAWNEIITKGDTYLFDAMHGNIFSIGNTSRNIVPQVFSYKITNPNNTNKLIPKYFDDNSTIGVIYRCLNHKVPITTGEAILTPTSNGYCIKPLSDNVLINGDKIAGVKELSYGDFVNLKDVGFQII